MEYAFTFGAIAEMLWTGELRFIQWDPFTRYDAPDGWLWGCWIESDYDDRGRYRRVVPFDRAEATLQRESDAGTLSDYEGPCWYVWVPGHGWRLPSRRSEEEA